MKHYSKRYTKKFNQQQFYHPSFNTNEMRHKDFVLWCKNSVAHYIKPTMIRQGATNKPGHWRSKEFFLRMKQGTEKRKARSNCWDIEDRLATQLSKLQVPSNDNPDQWENLARECARNIKTAYERLEERKECYIQLKPEVSQTTYENKHGSFTDTESQNPKYKLFTKISASLVSYCEKQILEGEEDYCQVYDAPRGPQRNQGVTQHQMRQGNEFLVSSNRYGLLNASARRTDLEQKNSTNAQVSHR